MLALVVDGVEYVENGVGSVEDDGCSYMVAVVGPGSCHRTSRRNWEWVAVLVSWLRYVAFDHIQSNR